MKMKALMVLVLFLFGTQPLNGNNAHAADNPQVALDTSKGRIVLELFADKAPISVENFLAYVNSGYYDDTIFHRVIPKFMIQGGGFTADMKMKPGRSPIRNEADNGLRNERGTIAMARTPDPHSASSQFFINTVDNDFLNHKRKDPRGWGYAVFGRVVEGMEVVDAISAVKTGIQGRYQDVPVEPVVIKHARPF
jgi:peptidyl-prolyl cis-trans isomerase B (cyclophilin B)